MTLRDECPKFKFQFVAFQEEERIKTWTPDADLWVAVLDQAIDDLLIPDLNGAAVEWFASTSDGPGSFRWICDHLEFDASAVQAALTRRENRKDIDAPTPLTILPIDGIPELPLHRHPSVR